MTIQLLSPTLSAQYAAASPFPHIVLDGLFASDRIAKAAADARSVRGTLSAEFYGQRRKTGTKDPNVMGQTITGLIEEMNASPFISWLENVTGIVGLQPDPTLFGGGLHQILRGGFLKVHADFSWHAELRMYRRVNVLLYLNEGWQDAWGGHLELWRTDMSECAARVAPIANRMAIFSTNADSFHGHPDPLACPEDAVRSSIALYYYTQDPAPGCSASEMTDYRSRPSERFWSPRALLHKAKIMRQAAPWA